MVFKSGELPHSVKGLVGNGLILVGSISRECRTFNVHVDFSQDPGSFNALVSRMSREAVETRYQLLPYLYTLFYDAHTEGGTVVRPVFHE